MEAVFLHSVNIAITASWLVLAVFLLRLALKKAPRWATCLLWGIVALRLILPFSLESALSLIPSSEPIFEQSVVTEAPSAQPVLPEENLGSQPSVNEPPSASGNQVIAPPSSGSLAPTPEASVDPMQIVLFVASLVWLCGVLAMLGYGAYSYWRLKYKLRASICKEGRVYLCDNVETPFILGVFRPRIYLPSGIGEGEIPYVIAHEEAHLKRRDHLWKPLGFLLLSVYWFNPLFWVAYILLCRDIENACDEKVIKNCDNAYRVGYSEALLSCSIHRRSVMACPVAFGETGVKSRIRAVLHYKKPAFWVILVAIVAIIVTCVCFLTDPVRDKDETTTAVTTEDVPVTQAPTTISNPYVFYEPTPTTHSGVDADGNRWFLATITGITEDSVRVTPHEECEESKRYTSESPLVLSKSLYKNLFQLESQSGFLQIGDEIRVIYQGEIETATFVSFSWSCFGHVLSLIKADLNQDGVKEEYIEAWGFLSGGYDGMLVIRDPAGPKTLIYGIAEESPLVGVVDIVISHDGKVILYGYKENENVVIAEICYHKEGDYFYLEFYNSTPQTPTTTAVTTTPVTPEPTLSGIDILYGDEADHAIDFSRKNEFSDSYHATYFWYGELELDYHQALVIKMIKCKNRIYEDLFYTVLDQYGDETWQVNSDYRWVVTIDGVPIEIERFFVYHYGESGTVYMDLGEDFLPVIPLKGEVHAYDILLQIYRAETDEVMYYAWFTDPRYEGLYEYSIPCLDGFIHYPDHAIEGASLVSGPADAERLFDCDFKTKLRTKDLTTPIIWKYDEAVTAVAYMFLGANDDASHPERLPTDWKIYGSNNGSDWVLIAEEDLQTPKETSDYTGRYAEFTTAVTYSCFKLEMTAPVEYQLSDIVLLSQKYN